MWNMATVLANANTHPEKVFIVSSPDLLKILRLDFGKELGKCAWALVFTKTTREMMSIVKKCDFHLCFTCLVLNFLLLFLFIGYLFSSLQRRPGNGLAADEVQLRVPTRLSLSFPFSPIFFFYISLFWKG